MSKHLKNAEMYISRSKSIFRFFKTRDELLKDAYKEYIIASNMFIRDSDIVSSVYYLEIACNLMFSILNYEDDVLNNYLKLIKLSKYVDSAKYVEYCEKIIPILKSKCNSNERSKISGVYEGLIFFYKTQRNSSKVNYYYIQLMDYYRNHEVYRFGNTVSEYVDYSVKNMDFYDIRNLSNLLDEASLKCSKHFTQTYLFESILLDVCNSDLENAREKMKRINSINREFFILSDLIFYSKNINETNNTIEKYESILKQKWYKLVIDKYLF